MPTPEAAAMEATSEAGGQGNVRAGWRSQRRLKADPEEVSHPRRQIEGGNVSGHVEERMRLAGGRATQSATKLHLRERDRLA